MKYKIIILTAIFTFLIFSANSQTTTWADNSANVVEKGRKEFGLFSPFVWGLKNNTELTVHPIYFFVMPNIGIKKQWKHSEKITISSVHKFTYPTFFLKLLARNGTGGILPPTSVIPHIFKFNNAILLSKSIKNHVFTFKAGVDLAFGAGESNFPTIEYHVVYPRVYALHNTFMPYAGLNINGKIYKRFDYDYSFNSFFLAGQNSGYILEQELKIIWKKSDRFAVKAGFVFEFGDYPYGLGYGMLPVFDLMFAL